MSRSNNYFVLSKFRSIKLFLCGVIAKHGNKFAFLIFNGTYCIFVVYFGIDLI